MNNKTRPSARFFVVYDPCCFADEAAAFLCLMNGLRRDSAT